MLIDRTVHPRTDAPIARFRVAAPAPGTTRRRLPITAMSALGAGLVVIGAAAPWLSFFAGLQPVRGTDGSWGVVLVVLGLTAGASAAIHQLTASPVTRWLLGAAGFGVLAIAGSLGMTLLAEFRMLAADPLLVARVEPGLGIVLLGGALLGATFYVPAGVATETASTPSSPTRAGLAVLVLGAGIVHLLLTQEHLADSTALGVGFLVVGIAQTVLAALLFMTGTRGLFAAALIVSAGSALALLAAVTVGLPIIGHGTAAGPLGPVETFDDLAGLTLLAEAGAVLLAVRLLRRP